jgi:tetratricopeptide (TPR) repeat protein
MLGVPLPASAATTLRFGNGREVVVDAYWYAGDQLLFSQARGAVGVPRGFVVALTDQPAPPKIGAPLGGVNACVSLSPRGRSVTLLRVVPTKDELYDRAVDFVADGKLDEAIATYQEAIAIDPGFTDALHGLAMAYADKGMFDEAIEHGRKLVALTPDDTLAHTSLSMFYQRKGMIAEAEAEGAKARVLDWKRQLAEQADQKKEGGGT